MYVLNSYLGLHIAAIMLTALPDHKTHTHKEHTDKHNYLTTHHSQAYSLTLSLFIALTYTFPMTQTVSEITSYLLYSPLYLPSAILFECVIYEVP